MYKPHTVEQYKICRYLKEQEGFKMEHFILSPLSRNALLLEDCNGEQIAFEIIGGQVHERLLPAPADEDVLKAFWEQFMENPLRPIFENFEDVTKWWLNNSNPLTYQQALGLSDGLYHHFLTHPLIRQKM